MTAPATIPSAEVQAKAQRLLGDRHTWKWARNKETGVAFVAVPSGDHVYQVRPDGRGCSCLAYQQGGLLCSHRLAVIGANHQDALASWIADASVPTDDGPLVCHEAHCDGVQEFDSVFCWRHSPVCAF